MLILSTLLTTNRLYLGYWGRECEQFPKAERQTARGKKKLC